MEKGRARGKRGENSVLRLMVELGNAEGKLFEKTFRKTFKGGGNSP